MLTGILENQSENIVKLFIKAHSEFKESKKSDKSVENLYDLIYLLKDKNRNSEEDYILANIYNLLGDSWSALQIINDTIGTANNKIKQKLIKLKAEIDKQNIQIQHIKKYRDLRDAKLIKQPTILKKEDFIVSIDELAKSHLLKLTKTDKNVVLLNKNVKIGKDYFIFSKIKPDEYIFFLIEEYIEWLGTLKDELLDFYNNNEFDYKVSKVGQDWFDGLKIWDINIEIDTEFSFLTTIFISDYQKNDFGFRLEIKNNVIRCIEYDPIL